MISTHVRDRYYSSSYPSLNSTGCAVKTAVHIGVSTLTPYKRALFKNVDIDDIFRVCYDRGLIGPKSYCKSYDGVIRAVHECMRSLRFHQYHPVAQVWSDNSRKLSDVRLVQEDIRHAAVFVKVQYISGTTHIFSTKPYYDCMGRTLDDYERLESGGELKLVYIAMLDKRV